MKYAPIDDRQFLIDLDDVLRAENQRLRAALEKAKLECEKSYDIGDLMYSDLYEYICEALEESKDE